MKKILLHIFFALTVASLYAQNNWIQKADYGGTSRYGAAGFSIGTKGYIGTGYDGASKKDFWEWDQPTNTWSQKASFPGTARFGASGFSIDTSGYIGLGYDSSGYCRDLWEWNQSSNTWMKKADFGGTARYMTASFTIGAKAYVGTGYDGIAPWTKDFWEWDQTTNAWTQKANFAGTGRSGATGFAIGTKGYISTGLNIYGIGTQDIWEWDQTSNKWGQKNLLPGDIRFYASSFVIGKRAYIVGGYTSASTLECWSWDQATNWWTQKANLTGARHLPVCFSIGLKGYVGTGWNSTVYYNDLWEYNPDSLMTGTRESENNYLISIFPNPSYGKIFISGMRSGELTLFNTLGERILEKNISVDSNKEIKLNNIPAGIYFVRILNEDAPFTKKIIVERD